MKKWNTIVLFLTICSASYSQPPDTIVVIHGKGTRGPYSLGARNVVFESVSLFGGGGSLDSSSFEIEFASGILWLENPLAISDSLTARFQFIPLDLAPQYYRHRLVSQSPDTLASEPISTRKSDDIGSDLRITGSKGFSVQTGQGTPGGLSQSLNLTIVGDIVPGLKTSAHISDKSSGKSGASRRIEELDKIYITAESDYFKGTFGDFDLHQERDPLLNLQRRLTGLNLNYNRAGNTMMGAAAFFPGEYSSITLSGQDGLLGPYYLTDIGGRRGVQVLPGSERVYLDGILQRRGSQNDYEIDYEAGAIRFAAAKVLRNETRITIDYEIAREEYSRNFYQTWGETYPSRGLRIFSSLIQEGDNKNSPRSFELSAENRQILASAGADRLAASLSGARLVGAGAGDYTIDTVGGAHYLFVGQNLGDYDVSFSFVGDGIGSYKARGAGIFDYLGPGLGDHEPVILIPPPQVRRYGSLGAAWNPRDSLFAFEVEAAGSDYDRNAHSEIDSQLRGGSILGKGLFKKRAFGLNGFLRIETFARSIGQNAVFPGRIDNVERYREYDLDSGLPASGENVQQIAFSGGPSQFRSLSFEAGRLTHPAIEDRVRYKVGANWRLFNPLDITSSVERTHGERTWWKNYNALAARFSRLQPSLRFNFEKRDGVAGFKYFEYIGTVPVQYADGISGATEVTIRDEKFLETVWRDKFISGSVQQKVEFTSGLTGFSGEVASSYYRKNYRQFAGTNAEQKTGRARLTYSDPQGRGGISINERLSSSNERLQAKNYVLVGDGQGEYRFQDGEYIRDPDGDYILVIEELGEGQRITEIATELNGNISPFMAIDKNRLLEDKLGRFNIESSLTHSLRKSSEILTGNDFFPWRGRPISNLSFQGGQLETRAQYYPPQGNHRIRYSLSRSFERGSQYANENLNSNSRTDELSWSFPAGTKLDITMSGQVSESKRRINEFGYDIDRWNAATLTNYRFREQWTLSLGAGFTQARQSDIGLRANLPATEIGLTRDLRNSGRISGRFIYTRLNVAPRDIFVPFQVAQGKNSGNNFESIITARMAVTRNGRFDFSYRYESFPGRPVKHNLRLEFTVIFL